jgi:hypothetical protein
MTHDIAGLEGKLRALGEATSKFTEAKHVDQLLPIIHRPGWTTVQEAALVHLMADTLQHQVNGLHQTFDALVRIADQIGKSE